MAFNLEGRVELSLDAAGDLRLVAAALAAPMRRCSARCFTFCGFNLFHLPHVNAMAVVAQLPWLLWAIDVAVCDPRPRWRLVASAAIALLTASQFLLGYPQYVWFSLLVEAGYAWWLLRSGPPHASRTRSIPRSRSRHAPCAESGWCRRNRLAAGAIQWPPGRTPHQRAKMPGPLSPNGVRSILGT